MPKKVQVASSFFFPAGGVLRVCFLCVLKSDVEDEADIRNFGASQILQNRNQV